MGVGAGGSRPLLYRGGGGGATPEKFLKKYYVIFKIKIIVISYLVELFIF